MFPDVEDPSEELRPEMGLVSCLGNLSSIEMLSFFPNDLRDERLLDFLVSSKTLETRRIILLTELRQKEVTIPMLECVWK